MKKSIYIFGHKNPDTDSVTSAISLAYLKNAQGIKCVPKVIGSINRETRFVLDYFKVNTPSYLNDVKLQIKDLNYNKKAYISEDASIEDTFNVLKQSNLTALPLVDNERHITGYVTLKGMAKYLIDGNREYIDTSLSHLLKTLNAKVIVNNRRKFKGQISAVTFRSDTYIKEVPLQEDNIIIVGDRYKVIEYAIASKVELIILTKNRKLPDNLIKKAELNNVSVISSSYTSFELSNRVSLANYIKNISDTDNPAVVTTDSYYTDFLNMAKKLNFTNYPVINNKGICLGQINHNETISYQKKKVILVDHNNYEQSIDGLDEADILEVFDHHNIGNIGTNMPIYFTCRPVGCTGTIIADRYHKEGVKIPKKMAGLMLSAVISDTLLLTSPTTTEIDIKYANELAKIAGVNLKKYGMDMLKAASSIEGLSINELINQDFKSYNISGHNYGIAVITTMDFDSINKQIDEYVQRLNEMTMNGYKGVFIFIADIIKQGSFVIYNDSSKDLISGAFDLKNVYEGIFIKNIISRKKQIIPAIMNYLG